jgi:hypothetical protein
MRAILTPKKFKKSLGWHGFIGLEVLWQNGQKLATSSFLQLCKSRNFTNSKTRYSKGDPLDFTQKAPLVCELRISSF